MGLVVLRGKYPTNRVSCPIGVIFLGVDVPRGNTVVLGGGGLAEG